MTPEYIYTFFVCFPSLMTVAFPSTLTLWDFRKEFTFSEEMYGYFLLTESWNSIVSFFQLMPHILKEYNILSD